MVFEDIPNPEILRETLLIHPKVVIYSNIDPYTLNTEILNKAVSKAGDLNRFYNSRVLAIYRNLKEMTAKGAFSYKYQFFHIDPDRDSWPYRKAIFKPGRFSDVDDLSIEYFNDTNDKNLVERSAPLIERFYNENVFG